MVGLLVAALVVLIGTGAANCEERPPLSIGGYELRLSTAATREEPEQRLSIYRNGNEVLHFQGVAVVIDRWFEAPKDQPFPPPGTNVAGGTTPQVIVQTYSGGAHCCIEVSVVDLGETPAVYAVPIGGNYMAFFRRGEDGRWEAVGYDNDFAYWRGPFATSPTPELIYRFDKGRFVVAIDRMKAPPPADEELTRDAHAIDWAKSDTRDERGVPWPLWYRTIDLIYTGNMQAAHRFFDLAWQGHPGEAAAWNDLQCFLRKSGRWPALAAMNGVPADAPVGSCGR